MKMIKKKYLVGHLSCYHVYEDLVSLKELESKLQYNPNILFLHTVPKAKIVTPQSYFYTYHRSQDIKLALLGGTHTQSHLSGCRGKQSI